jgi:hypothetical protein
LLPAGSAALRAERGRTNPIGAPIVARIPSIFVSDEPVTR